MTLGLDIQAKICGFEPLTSKGLALLILVLDLVVLLTSLSVSDTIAVNALKSTEQLTKLDWTPISMQ